MSEPRFPPPGYQGSYREPALVDATEEARAEVPIEKRHVVVTRPDDPDVPHLDPLEVARQNDRVALHAAVRRRRYALTFVVLTLVIIVLAVLSRAAERRHMQRLEDLRRQQRGLPAN